MKKKNIIIVGHSGFIGQSLYKILDKKNNKIILISRKIKKKNLMSSLLMCLKIFLGLNF